MVFKKSKRFYNTFFLSKYMRKSNKVKSSHLHTFFESKLCIFVLPGLVWLYSGRVGKGLAAWNWNKQVDHKFQVVKFRVKC